MTVEASEINLSFDRLCSAQDAVLWTMSPAGAITHISESIMQVRGITPEEALAQTPDQMLTQNSLRDSLTYFERLSRDVQAGRAPEPFYGDFEYLHKDGSIVVCEVVALPVFDPDGVFTELRGVSAARR